MGFKEDMALSVSAMPYQDELYRKIFPIKHIERFKKGEERHILDREYHIDVVLHLQNDIKLFGQEKALRERCSGFDTFTIEFYQNRHTKEKGEFFNLGAQFYSHGYLNGNRPKEVTGFIKVYIIKVFDYLEWLKQKPIALLEKNTLPLKVGGSRASFYWIKYKDIPERFIYYKNDPTKDNIIKKIKRIRLQKKLI